MNSPRLLPFALMLCRAAAGVVMLGCTAAAAEFRFSFGSGNVEHGFVQVARDSGYDANRAFGFMPAGAASGGATIFAVDVAEGNYDVTMTFGDPKRATSTTVKAEQRRLMLENVETPAGRFETRTFTVNVRKPEISTGGTTMLNTRELGPPVAANWDERLSFEFNGKSPGVVSMEIKPAQETVTIFLAGDSTVTDQRREPWGGWGQMLPRFFQSGVAISNHAESGLALSSFKHQKRLEKVLSMMKKGDYLFIQFGHNDQKSKAPGAGAFTTYADGLKDFIAAARSKGGIPVVVTPMERRRWEGHQLGSTLDDYAAAARQVAKREHAVMIDLHAMSLQFYAALGPEGSKGAFGHYPAGSYPGQEKALKDDTHHNSYGGYQLARCVVEGIKAQLPELAARLAKDVSAFDPSKPDLREKFDLPASPSTEPIEKPAGS